VRRCTSTQSVLLLIAFVATTVLGTVVSPGADAEGSAGQTATAQAFHKVVKATMDADSFTESQGSIKILYEAPNRGEVVSSLTGHPLTIVIGTTAYAWVTSDSWNREPASQLPLRTNPLKLAMDSLRQMLRESDVGKQGKAFTFQFVVPKSNYVKGLSGSELASWSVRSSGGRISSTVFQLHGALPRAPLGVRLLLLPTTSYYSGYGQSLSIAPPPSTG
jgi:hypothetical protein